MRLLNKKIVMVAPIVFALTISSGEVFAEKKEPNLSNISNKTFLFKNKDKMNLFLKKVKKSEFDVKVINEILLVQLKSLSNSEISEKNLHTLSNEYAKSIEFQGELPKLKNDSYIKQDLNPKVKSKVKSKISRSSLSKNKADYYNIEQYPDVYELNNPMFDPFNWYVKQTMDEQYNLAKRGLGTSIALIDSGVDPNHPLFKGKLNLRRAKNYVNDDKNISDSMGHGTSVAAVISNIAPEAKITPYKVLDKTDGESIWVLEAIIDAAKNKNDVINLSLGTYKNSKLSDEAVLIKAYKRAVDYAGKKGSIVVAAAGNSSKNLDDLKNTNTIYLPGNIKDVITVSATNINKEVSSYSNTGKNIDFAAPGGDLNEKTNLFDVIVSAHPTYLPQTELDTYVGMPQGYTLAYGTSLAAPQVSASVLVVKSKMSKHYRKNVSNESIVKVLKKSAIDLGLPGRDDSYGYGQINLGGALNYLK